VVSVLEATKRDIEEIAKRDRSLAESALAALALALAAEMDKPSNSATSKSMCGKTMLDALKMLRELVPEVREASPLDEIRARRDAKLARKPAAKARVRP
jgi:hypothetical protein